MDVTTALEQIIFSHHDPNTWYYVQYYDYLKGYNQQIQKVLVSYLSDLFKSHKEISLENTAVSVVGSDARLEKGEKSQIELLFVTDAEKDFFGGAIKAIQENSRVFNNLELKDNNEDMALFQNNRSTKFPSRALDSRFIIGNHDELFSQMKEKLNWDIAAGYSSLKKALKERIRYYRGIMLEGRNRFKGEEIIHYDLEKGITYYNEKENMISFKGGPLRLVNSILTRNIIGYIKNQPEDASFTKNLPANIKQRIYYLLPLPEFSLTSRETDLLTDDYAYFLWQYHRSQCNSHREKQCETEFDAKEVKERIKELDSLLRKPILTYENC
ncbi:MAG TPA: hypothetical protein ENN46_01735 [Candidatus Woesearchaeota archaeon]|nr:hypothetical protein [Candidatus Woesearchaeota archaeon]